LRQGGAVKVNQPAHDEALRVAAAALLPELCDMHAIQGIGAVLILVRLDVASGKYALVSTMPDARLAKATCEAAIRGIDASDAEARQSIAGFIGTKGRPS
jgi:hypothetical protein